MFPQDARCIVSVIQCATDCVQLNVLRKSLTKLEGGLPMELGTAMVKAIHSQLPTSGCVELLSILVSNPEQHKACKLK